MDTIKEYLQEEVIYTGAVEDKKDSRDFIYDDDVALGATTLVSDEEWLKGYDIEKVIGTKIPFKNQQQSYSCVAQAFSYYLAVLNTIETGKYDEVSAKAIYSQISIGHNAGAYLRDGAKLAVDWGALLEKDLRSYKENGTTDEDFMRDKTWITPEINKMAQTLASKEYKTIKNLTMDVFASAIRDGQGMVAAVYGSNNGTWYTNEPKPPTSPQWAHALFFGKFGTDEKGRYIATPNSWGTRGTDSKHPDGWQRFYEEWFAFGGTNLFNPWVLIDKPNELDMKLLESLKKRSKYFFRPEKNGEAYKIYEDNSIKYLNATKCDLFTEMTKDGTLTPVSEKDFNSVKSALKV